MPGAFAIDFPRRSFKSLGVLESSLGETLISPLSNDTFPRTSFKRPGLQRPKKRTLSRRIGCKPNKVKLKSLNGYDAIREKLDENDTLTIKHQPIESVQPKTKQTWLLV